MTKECPSCNNNNNKACVSIVPIFNHLDESQMVEIMNVTRSVKFKKGSFIYRAGDKSDSLYIVSRGRVKIFRLSDNGKEQLLRILNPGDFTGELALFSETTHESFAQAIEETNCCTVKRDDMQALIAKFPSISLKLLSEFSSRLENSEKQTTRFATESVETRLALFLCECLDSRNPDSIITLPMSRKDLASYLGTTPETISRKLHDFEMEGFIKQIGGRKIEITDPDGLLMV